MSRVGNEYSLMDAGLLPIFNLSMETLKKGVHVQDMDTTKDALKFVVDEVKSLLEKDRKPTETDVSWSIQNMLSARLSGQYMRAGLNKFNITGGPSENDLNINVPAREQEVANNKYKPFKIVRV